MQMFAGHTENNPDQGVYLGTDANKHRAHDKFGDDLIIYSIVF